MTHSNSVHKVFLLLVDMFQNSYRIIVLLVIVSMIISCSKEASQTEPPVIELIADSGFIGNAASVAPGSLMKFRLKLQEGSEKLTNFYIEVSAAGQEPKRYFDTAMYVSELMWTGSFYKSPEPDEVWTFHVRDRQGGSNQTEIEITADTNSAYHPVLSIDNIKMGAQNNIQIGAFYSFESQIVYFTQEAKENQDLIDLVFYYGVDESSIASPGANIETGIFPDNISPVNWTIRNTTRFIKTSLTENDFNNVTSDSTLIANYVDADGKRKAKNLTAGDIYVFKNQSNRLGLFMVNSVAGTEVGEVNIDVKIQNPAK